MDEEEEDEEEEEDDPDPDGEAEGLSAKKTPPDADGGDPREEEELEEVAAGDDWSTGRLARVEEGVSIVVVLSIGTEMVAPSFNA